MAEKQKVGFIGVGLMGHGMAKNILEQGYPLWVMGHKNRAPVEDLVKRGAEEAKSARAMAEACDVIFLCVTGSPQVEALVRGEDVNVAGFGRFFRKSRPAREGRNPRTGERIAIGPSSTGSFRAGKALKDAFN